jgi:hypothetical protein
VCVRAWVWNNKKMAGSARHLFMKQNTLLPSVVINFGFVIQPQSCNIREYLKIIIILISVIVFEWY